MKFRQHRGGFQESIDTLVEIPDNLDFLAGYLNGVLCPSLTRLLTGDDLSFTSHKVDVREQWNDDSWTVSADGYGVIGYVNTIPEGGRQQEVSRKPDFRVMFMVGGVVLVFKSTRSPSQFVQRFATLITDVTASSVRPTKDRYGMYGPACLLPELTVEVEAELRKLWDSTRTVHKSHHPVFGLRCYISHSGGIDIHSVSLIPDETT